MRFSFEMRFDELPPEPWLSSFMAGKEVRIEVGQQLFDGMYRITALEITFQELTPRFKTRLVFMRTGPLEKR
jgi:hypothetical protein